MASDWNADRMLELATRHARVESQKRLDELMETLVEEPVYEFLVQGLTLRGGVRVRRYYRQFFDDYMSHVTGGQRLGQWGDEKAVAREDAIEVRGPDGPEIHRITSVLFAEGDRLGGERIYASDRVVRMMAGEMFAELEPIENNSDRAHRRVEVTPDGGMDDARLREQEEAFARALGSGALHALRDYYVEDVVYLSPTVRLYGWEARIEGFERMVEFVRLTLATCREIEYQAVELAMLADGRSAFARIHFDWDFEGKARLRSNYVVLYRYREGRIAQQELYYDPSGQVERIGEARVTPVGSRRSDG